MRIIAGIYKSRLVYSPKGVEMRPTSDRVKESLFGILGAFVIDKAALDLFSGTGNLGLEALSRGAASCVFVDSNPRCVEAIKKNLELLNIIACSGSTPLDRRGWKTPPIQLCPLVDRRDILVPPFGGVGKPRLSNLHTEVVLKDAFKYIKEAAAKGAKFDIIFLDPPYYKDMVKKSLILLDYYNIITDHSVVIAEHHKKDELPAREELKNLKLFRQEKYGGTFLSFYK